MPPGATRPAMPAATASSRPRQPRSSEPHGNSTVTSEARPDSSDGQGLGGRDDEPGVLEAALARGPCGAPRRLGHGGRAGVDAEDEGVGLAAGRGEHRATVTGAHVDRHPLHGGRRDRRPSRRPPRRGGVRRRSEACAGAYRSAQLRHGELHGELLAPDDDAPHPGHVRSCRHLRVEASVGRLQAAELERRRRHSHRGPARGRRRGPAHSERRSPRIGPPTRRAPSRSGGASPEPKWKSSAPLNVPLRMAARPGVAGDRRRSPVIDGSCDTSGPDRRTWQRRRRRCGSARWCDDGAGSISDVRMNSGEPRYHATGPPTTSIATASAALVPGASGRQRASRDGAATTMPATSAIATPMAIGTRSG